jgi:hypothetical protein
MTQEAIKEAIKKPTKIKRKLNVNKLKKIMKH